MITSQVNKERQLDSDYSAFMAELDGKSAPPAAAASGENGATICQPVKPIQPFLGTCTNVNRLQGSAIN